MTRAACVEQTTMTARDGTLLATELWLPGNDEPRPVVLVRTPYSIEGARAAHDPLSWLKNGWAVMLQDVRGRYGSQGQFNPFHQEIRDGRDAITWAARQPWSDGRVVTTGASYLGATQWLAASTAPPPLRAISPMITAPSFHEGWTYENGAFHVGVMNQWSLDMAATAVGAPADRLSRIAELRSDLLALAARPTRENGIAAVFPAYEHFTDYGASSYWRGIDVTRRFSRLDVAGYHVAGWYDIFCDSSIAAYQGLRAHAGSDYARTSQRLVIGPWVHVNVFGTGTGTWDFGPEANGFAKGFPQEMNALLTGALGQREVPTGVSAFVMGANRWMHLPDWPPPSRPRELFLDDLEALVRQPPPASGTDGYSHDPADPVPNRGGRTLGEATPMAGPCDQRDIEARDDVLVYTSAPLTQDEWVVGAVQATLWFGSDAAETDVVVTVVDVLPDGRAINVVSGVRRVAGSTRAHKVQLTVGSTAHCFRAGHRVRVHVASADFPRIALAPAGRQTVFRGGRTPSAITLPVVRAPR